MINLDNWHPLFIEADINRVLVKGALVDMGFINIVLRALLEVVKIPSRTSTTQRLQIFKLSNVPKSIELYIQLDLKVSPIRALIVFHVMDVETSYHILLGRLWLRLWLNKHMIVPFTYYQCVKERIMIRPICIVVSLT